jgi:hypothetical protein
LCLLSAGKYTIEPRRGVPDISQVTYRNNRLRT